MAPMALPLDAPVGARLSNATVRAQRHEAHVVRLSRAFQDTLGKIATQVFAELAADGDARPRRRAPRRRERRARTAEGPLPGSFGELLDVCDGARAVDRLGGRSWI